MTTEKNLESGSITVSDDSFLDVDLIEVDDLINSATRLLDEVFSSRQMPTPILEALSPRQSAIQQVERFLSSIRETEANQDDDVVFVEARPGNALPSNVRSIAVVDLCSPVVSVSAAAPAKQRGRRRSTATPQSLFQNDVSPPKSRRINPKKEPGTAVADASSVSNDSSTTEEPVQGPSLMCAVCMESVVHRQPTSTSCGHIFCQKCIHQAIRLTKKCPLCNSKLTRTQVHRVYF